MTFEDEIGGSETPSEALTPGVDGVETGVQAPTEEGWREWYRRLSPLLGYLPTGTQEEDTERDGLLSYSVEAHSAIIGVAIGATAATTGDVQLIMGLVAVALGVGRVQQQFSETVRSQILKEPWYSLTGAALGYLGMYYSQTGQLPLP